MTNRNVGLAVFYAFLAGLAVVAMIASAADEDYVATVICVVSAAVFLWRTEKRL